MGYDQAGRLTSLGDYVLEYDDRSLLTKVTKGSTQMARFTYNALNNPVQRVDTSGTANFTWDDDGKLATAEDSVTGLTYTYHYDAGDRLTSLTSTAPKSTQSFTYDDLDRLTSQSVENSSGSQLAEITYGWDLDDQLTSKTTSGTAGAGTNTYAYDQAGRLSSWTAPNGNVTTYEWDPAGNRVKAGDKTFAYDERNRLLSGDGSEYTYTPRGTLATETKAGATRTLKFDAFDRMISDGDITYGYDAFDRVISRTKSGTEQRFLYSDLTNDIASVTDGAGVVTAKYGRAPEGALLSLQENGGSALSVLSNLHDDVVGTFTGSTNALVDSVAYDPFGEVVAHSGTRPSLGYQGEWTDTDTGKVNMHARWYQPGTGSFGSRDTWNLDPDSSAVVNRYLYGLGNPLIFQDPTGHGTYIQASPAAMQGQCQRGNSQACSAYENRVGADRANKGVWEGSPPDLPFGGKRHKGAHRASGGGKHSASGGRASSGSKGGKSAGKGSKPTSAKHRSPGKKPNKGKKPPKHEKSKKNPKKSRPSGSRAHAHSSVKPRKTSGRSGGSRGSSGGKKGGNGKKGSNGKKTGGSGGKKGGSSKPTSTRKSTTKAKPSKEEEKVFYDIGGSGVNASVSVSGSSRKQADSEINSHKDVVENTPNAADRKVDEIIDETAPDLPPAPPPITNRRSCTPNSFVSGTQVLMADGSTKAIEDIEIGDRVVATDVETGRTEGRPVKALITGEGIKSLTEITIDIDGDRGQLTDSITATDGHPFWLPDLHKWVTASELEPGMWLQTSAGTHVQITAIKKWTARERVHNLTVEGLHTYYVLAGTTPVLVHNSGPCTLGAQFGVPEKPGIYSIHLNSGEKYVGMSTANINTRVTASMKPNHAVGSRGYGPNDVANVTWFELPSGVTSVTARRIEQTVMEGWKSQGVKLLNRRDPEFYVPFGGYLP